MNERTLVPTGTIIKEYLSANSITNKDFANKTGLSEKHISNVLNNKARLTEEFAIKLERVMPSVKADYWVNYESKYRLQLARFKDLNSITSDKLKTLSKRFLFKEVFKGLSLTKNQQAIEMLNILKISNFNQFPKAFDNLNIDSLEDGGSKEAIAIWLSLCENEIDIQNEDLDSIPYNKKELKKLLPELKQIASTLDLAESINGARKLLNKAGIYFVDYEALTNSKVRGALTTYRNNPAIYISYRFRRPSIIWFAIFHEISHLILHYNKKEVLITIDGENEKEKQANSYARNILVNENEYNEFIEKAVFTKKTITEFAASQNIAPSFIVDFLHHDKIVDFKYFNKL